MITKFDIRWGFGAISNTRPAPVIYTLHASDLGSEGITHLTWLPLYLLEMVNLPIYLLLQVHHKKWCSLCKKQRK
jgi:hypothetical protein